MGNIVHHKPHIIHADHCDQPDIETYNDSIAESESENANKSPEKKSYNKNSVEVKQVPDKLYGQCLICTAPTVSKYLLCHNHIYVECYRCKWKFHIDRHVKWEKHGKRYYCSECAKKNNR